MGILEEYRLTDAIEGVEKYLAPEAVPDSTYADTLCRQLRKLLRRAEGLRDALASVEHPGQQNLFPSSENDSQDVSANSGEETPPAKA